MRGDFIGDGSKDTLAFVFGTPVVITALTIVGVILLTKTHLYSAAIMLLIIAFIMLCIYLGVATALFVFGRHLRQWNH